MSNEMRENTNTLLSHSIGRMSVKFPDGSNYKKMRLQVWQEEKVGSWKKGYLFEGIFVLPAECQLNEEI